MTWVFYHSNCMDGFGAAYVMHWPEPRAKFRAFNYGEIETIDDILAITGPLAGERIYILDFSFPREVMDALFEQAERVVWLDHHKTAFEMWGAPEGGHSHHNYMGRHHIVLNNNASGAMLTWDYVYPNNEPPRYIRAIDDRDRWQFKLEGSREFHAAMSLVPKTFVDWDVTLGRGFETLVAEGELVLRVYENQVKDAMRNAQSCTLRLPGEYAVGLASQSATHSSEIGHQLAEKSGTYGLVWWYDHKNEEAVCSLRSVGDYDVSALAKQYGGGGHKNAAGFRIGVAELFDEILTRKATREY
jgi:oligoribonuclease NrnB/cAMP/cGMP phosphodiesterase (DHH superfamily)